jgi:hypothetical protein
MTKKFSPTALLSFKLLIVLFTPMFRDWRGSLHRYWDYGFPQEKAVRRLQGPPEPFLNDRGRSQPTEF